MPSEALQPQSDSSSTEEPSRGEASNDAQSDSSGALRYVLYVGSQAGTAAFFVGIALAGAVVRFREPGRRLAAVDAHGSAFSSLPGTTESLLWVLFQAHGVDIASSESSSDPETAAAIADAAVVDPGWLVVAVPVVLLAAGAGTTAVVEPQSLRGAAGTGAAIVAAYAPLSAVAAWLATYSPSTVTIGIEGDSGPGTAAFGDAWAVGFSIGPDPLAAVALAGVAYPIAFGAVGGTAVSLGRKNCSETRR